MWKINELVLYSTNTSQAGAPAGLECKCLDITLINELKHLLSLNLCFYDVLPPASAFKICDLVLTAVSKWDIRYPLFLELLCIVTDESGQRLSNTSWTFTFNMKKTHHHPQCDSSLYHFNIFHSVRKKIASPAPSLKRSGSGGVAKQDFLETPCMGGFNYSWGSGAA